MTEGHHPVVSNGSRLLTVDMLIKVLLLTVAAVLSYQRVQDRQDFLDSRVKGLELWQDTERQLVISLDRRLAIVERERERERANDPSITIKRR